MIIEQIRSRLQNGFHPFRLELSSGKKIRVPHQDFIAIHPKAIVVIDQKGISHATVTQSGDILQSMDIDLKEKIFESIRLGKANGPVQGLKELEAIRVEKNKTTLQSLAARVGDIKFLETLALEEGRALFLKELDKQKKILSPQEQTAILDYLAQQRGIRDLILPNFSAIAETTSF